MKKNYFYLAIVLLWLSSFLSVNAQKLSGTYVVGSGGDFTSIQAAVDSLVKRGISANVVLDIKDGTYNENVSVNDTIDGILQFTVTFKSQSNDSSKVIMNGNAVTTFNNNSYPANYIFSDLTITQTAGAQSIFSFSPAKNNHVSLTINRCQFKGNTGTYQINFSGYDMDISKLWIENSSFKGSNTYFLYVSINDNDSEKNESVKNVSINKNTMSGGAYLYSYGSIENVNVQNNTGTQNFGNYGFYFQSSADIKNLTAKKLKYTSASSALYLQSSMGMENIFIDSVNIISTSGYGLQINNNTKEINGLTISNSSIRAYNNIVYVFSSHDILNLNVTNDSLLYHTSYNQWDYQAYFYSSKNIVNSKFDKVVTLQKTNTYGFYVGANKLISGLTLSNSNIKSHYDTFYLEAETVKNFIASKDSISSVTYRALYIYGWKKIDSISLEEVAILNQNSEGMRLSSDLEISNVSVNKSSFITNGNGVSIYSDIAVNNLSFNNSNFKTNGNGISIEADQNVKDVIVEKTIFNNTNWNNGFYIEAYGIAENISITHSKFIGYASAYIYGYISSKKILFDRDTIVSNSSITGIDLEAELDELSDIKITNSKIQTNGGTGIYLYNMRDINNVIIENDSIINRGGNWGRTIEFETDYGYANATIRNNNFLMDNNSNGYGIDAWYAGNLIIDNNSFKSKNNGYFEYPINFGGIDEFDFNENNEVSITNNYIEGVSSSAIYLEYLNGKTNITNNTIKARINSGIEAVYPYYVNGELTINNNTILLDTLQGSWGGLYFQETKPNKGLVYNNFISGKTYYGLYLENSSNIELINNTLSLNMQDSTYTAVYLDGEQTINNTFTNNIFSMYKEGRLYGMYLKTNLDNNIWKNNLYNRPKDSVSFAYLDYGSGTFVDTLSVWQSTFKKDSLSIIKKVSFINDTNNLHLACGTTGLDKSIPYSFIKFDIDGQPRAAQATLGADEVIAAGATITYADVQICGNNLVSIDAGYFAGATYAWSNSKTGQKISVNTPGAYTVTITSGGCGSITGTINVKPIQPVANFEKEEIFTAVEFTNTSSDAVSYLWDFGDGKTSTEVNPVHIYKAVGKYTATLTAYAHCDTVTKSVALDFSYISTEEIFEGVSVYPNPAISNITISFAAPVDATVQVVNMAGTQVASKNIEAANEVNIDLSAYASGMYIIKIMAAEQTIIRKIIKE